MTRRRTIGMLALMSLALIASWGQQSKTAARGPKDAATKAPNQVVSIKLPSLPGEVLQGPDVQVFEKNCLICHTSRYINMQPHFPRAVWESEVKKMIDAYGASIPDSDKAKIVEYLVAVRGVPENK